MIIASSNSESEHGRCEIEESIHDAASKSKGQDILSVLPAVMCPVPHCTQSRTAHDIQENREQRFQHDLNRHGHGIWCAYYRSR